MNPQPPNIPDSEAPNHPTIQPSNHNSNITIISMALFVLMSLGIIIFLYYQNQQLKSLLAKYQTPPVSPTPTATADPTANWKTYTISTEPTLNLENYQIKLPPTWVQIEHSPNIQNTETFQDTNTNFIYQLIIYQEKNINPQTSKPYLTLKELTGFPYDVKSLIVDGTPAAQVLPRAGGESDYAVLFFSKDNKLTFNIALNTPPDGSKIQEGETLFTQILSTFKFTDSQTSAITSDAAIQIVNNLPEVKSFFDNTTNAKIAVEEGQGNFWLVHVYESFPDHNATFHWYQVDKITGKVTKQV